jgi:hypothetical protein
MTNIFVYLLKLVKPIARPCPENKIHMSIIELINGVAKTTAKKYKI